MTIYNEILALLIDIESELRNLECWGEERPQASAYNSEQPFFVDTMNFLQWLQFVFIERIRVMAESTLPLPESCGTAPMAEEYFRVLPVNAGQLIIHLQALDELITNA